MRKQAANLNPRTWLMTERRTVQTPHLAGSDLQTGSEKHDPTRGAHRKSFKLWRCKRAKGTGTTLRHATLAVTEQCRAVTPIPKRTITREEGPFYKRLLINQANYSWKQCPTMDKRVAAAEGLRAVSAPQVACPLNQLAFDHFSLSFVNPSFVRAFPLSCLS